MNQGLKGDCKDRGVDRFRVRMEAQCCCIREYRRNLIRNEGRELSFDEAALEWIERHAEGFAREHGPA